MNKLTRSASNFPNHKTVYGPVKSWRFGLSLGVDPIFVTSTCSFNCVYCQLGQIQDVTEQVKEYVPTQQILEDFKEVMDQPMDVLTYSGSGEPSLASNLDEMIHGIRQLKPDLTQLILTNGTHLRIPKVKENLLKLDRVIIKLDASDQLTLNRINRAHKNIRIEEIVAGILEFKQAFQGKIDIQMMLMNINTNKVDELALLLKKMAPNTVQLNTPTRPYPLSWHRENRGNHEKIFSYPVQELRPITKEQARKVESFLKDQTGLNILSVYRD